MTDRGEKGFGKTTHWLDHILLECYMILQAAAFFSPLVTNKSSTKNKVGI